MAAHWVTAARSGGADARRGFLHVNFNCSSTSSPSRRVLIAARGRVTCATRSPTSLERRGIDMLRTLGVLAIGTAALLAGPQLTGAADLGKDHNSPVVERARDSTAERSHDGCHRIWMCSVDGCDWRRFCPRICPSRYSCFPLYGAYGPYGGTSYWGAYTYSGWGYR